MVMDTMQIRMHPKLIKLIDSMIRTGIYSNRSELIRDAVRRFVWEREVGSIPNNAKNSVKEIREIREKLSKEKLDLDKINNFGKSQ